MIVIEEILIIGELPVALNQSESTDVRRILHDERAALEVEPRGGVHRVAVGRQQQRFRVGEHSRYLLPHHLGLMQGSFRRQIQQRVIRNTAPDEERQP